MDGHLEALVPACTDGPKCLLPKLFVTSVKKLFDAGDDFDFETVEFDWAQLAFDVEPGLPNDHPYRSVLAPNFEYGDNSEISPQNVVTRRHDLKYLNFLQIFLLSWKFCHQFHLQTKVINYQVIAFLFFLILFSTVQILYSNCRKVYKNLFLKFLITNIVF